MSIQNLIFFMTLWKESSLSKLLPAPQNYNFTAKLAWAEGPTERRPGQILWRDSGPSDPSGPKAANREDVKSAHHRCTLSSKAQNEDTSSRYEQPFDHPNEHSKGAMNKPSCLLQSTCVHTCALFIFLQSRIHSTNDIAKALPVHAPAAEASRNLPYTRRRSRLAAMAWSCQGSFLVTTSDRDSPR